MFPTSTLRTVALVAGCLDQQLPLAELRGPGDGPSWSFTGGVHPDRICTRPAAGRDRGPVTFGRTRPDGVVWLFDTLTGAHLLLRPSRRGTWQLAGPGQADRGSVHTAPGVVAVHLGPLRTEPVATGVAPGPVTAVFTLVARPGARTPAVPEAAVRQHWAALRDRPPSLSAAA